MLPFDFDYYLPKNLKEAVELYRYLDQQGKQPMFFSGGTELITLGRIDLAYTEAVIDIKEIAECQMIQFSDHQLLIGSAVTLTQLEEANPFPLLTSVSSEVADHTARGKITLGGNICAQIFYREAVLPFLLADSELIIAGPEGLKTIQINEIFQEQLRLKKGELLVQTSTDKRFIEAPFYAVKRRQQWDTGYPLITLAALKMGQELRVAISGLCPFPFRSPEVETYLNRWGQAAETRVDNALSALPKPILEDVEGSADYRLFVLRHLLVDALSALERAGA